MSTTPEEQIKQANRVEQRKRQGFITHLKAAGKSDEATRHLYSKYPAQDASRTRNLTAIQAAILPPRV